MKAKKTLHMEIDSCKECPYYMDCDDYDLPLCEQCMFHGWAECFSLGDIDTSESIHPDCPIPNP